MYVVCMYLSVVLNNERFFWVKFYLFFFFFLQEVVFRLDLFSEFGDITFKNCKPLRRFSKVGVIK